MTANIRGQLGGGGEKWESSVEGQYQRARLRFPTERMQSRKRSLKEGACETTLFVGGG